MILIDSLARAWLRRRIQEAIAGDADIQELKLQEVEIGDGGYIARFISPDIAMLAGECADMLNKANAENYIQFDMMPAASRAMRPVRVTVAWAKGKSPAQRVQELEAENADLKAKIEFGQALVERLRDEIQIVKQR